MELEVKQPTTYEQQVDKLRSRGCIIDDPALCIQKLKEINYYRFTAYFISFWQENDHDKYIPGRRAAALGCNYGATIIVSRSGKMEQFSLHFSCYACSSLPRVH